MAQATIRNVPGDCNGDARVDMADTVFLLEFLFYGGRRPDCRPRCHGKDSAHLDIADAVYLLDFLFSGGPAPEPLRLPPETCGDRVDNDCDGTVDEGCDEEPPDGLDTVSLVWDPVTRDSRGGQEALDSYRVHLGTRPGLYSQEIVVQGCACVELALRRGVLYYVAVSAMDVAGNEGPLSNEIQIQR